LDPAEANDGDWVPFAADWIEDAAILALLVSAAAILAAIVLFMVVF